MLKNCDLPLLAEADVVVCGGGITGVATAIAAAEHGADVLIVEKSGCLGGMATGGLVSMFSPRSDGNQDLSRGICSRIISKMCRRMGVAPDASQWQAINPEILKSVLDTMISDSGVKVLFECKVAAVGMNDGKLQTIITADNNGLSIIRGKVFIDATGDALLAHCCKVPCEFGGSGTLPMSPTLCALYTNIDCEKYLQSGKNAKDIWLDLLAKGETPLPEYHFVGIKFNGPHSGCANLGHIYGVNTIDQHDLSRSFFEGRRIAEKFHEFYRQYVPGFENCELTATGTLMGVRESRRIQGDYRLVFDDYCRRADFDDEIGRFNYPVDIHASADSREAQENVEKLIMQTVYNPGDSYGIPYRSMLPVGIKNLLVPGRALSADREIQSSIRVMPGCCITGQAAGIAAAMAVGCGGEVRQISIAGLQEKLRCYRDIQE